MHTVDVAVPGAPYRVTIDAGAIARGASLRPLVRGPSVLLVTDSNVGPHHAAAAVRQLADLQVTPVELPAGEEHKTLASAARLWDALAQARLGRDATVVALGGGVVGDLAGFAAATWQRGIDLLQVPSSLLAMVDAAVGGKCALDLPQGKNLVGAFHQPRAVLVDPELLATLDDRELRAGLAEAIKIALAFDAAAFAALERDVAALLAREPAALERLIVRSIALKAAVVGRDPDERGERALLNLGHTFGHAIEAAQGYRGWRHGEAVACGLAMAARASCARGTLAAADRDRVLALLARAGLPLAPPREVGRAALEALFPADKKARGGRPRFVMLRGLGAAELVGDLTEAALDAAFAT
jgi:3-dehydroquinate synthase